MDNKKQEYIEKKSKKKISIILLILLLLSVSIGFALLTATLNISGTSTIVGSTWDVHFDNLVPVSGSITPDVEAIIEDDELNISYTITLDKPGDFYAFTVDVVNEGSIDAKLSALPTITGVSQEQDVYTNYTFTHTDGSDIEVGEVIPAGESCNFTVRVEFDKNITSDAELPKTNQSMDLDVEMIYEQK